MHHANDTVIMQTSQLGQIEALEDRVHDLEGKLEAQDTLISNLVSNNLNHLQSNMTLTQHINRLEVWWSNNKKCLRSIESVLHDLQHIVGAETDTDLDSLGLSTSKSGRDGEGRPVGREVSKDAGVVMLESMRLSTPAPRERGLIEEMEEEVRKAVLGGWFNREDQTRLLESWSGSNSRTLSSQD